MLHCGYCGQVTAQALPRLCNFSGDIEPQECPNDPTKCWTFQNLSSLSWYLTTFLRFYWTVNWKMFENMHQSLEFILKIFKISSTFSPPSLDREREVCSGVLQTLKTTETSWHNSSSAGSEGRWKISKKKTRYYLIIIYIHRHLFSRRT